MVINKLGIIGYGRFGKLLADILSDEFNIMPYDAYFSTGLSIKEVALADAIFLCVPIVELKATIKNIAPLVQSNTNILDVCSVKLYPESLMTEYFPSENVLPTHPMFGPDAAKRGLNDLPIALCPTKSTKKEIVEYWSDVFTKHKLKIKLMSCDEHDKNTAYSLCLTQFVGRALEKLELKSSEIDTQNYRNLLTIRDMALNDSCQLFEGLQKLNPYAEKMRTEFIDALGKTNKKINNT
jgi:prephenate dehydrogenase